MVLGEKAPLYTCKFCKKTFTHAPAHVQHERAHAAAGAPAPDSSGGVAAAWVREVKPQKDASKPAAVVYRQQHAPEGGRGAVLRSVADAEKWLAAQEGPSLTIADFDFTPLSAVKLDGAAAAKEEQDAPPKGQDGAAAKDEAMPDSPLPQDEVQPPPLVVVLACTLRLPAPAVRIDWLAGAD